jgi:hydrogenase-4 component E
MSYEFASGAIDTLSIAMLIAALGIVWTRSLGWALVLFGAQSLMLAAAALYAGLATDSPHIVAAAGLTVLVKVVAAPSLLWLLLQRLPTSHDAQPSLGQRSGLVVAVLMAIVFAYRLDAQPFHTAIGAERVLPTAVAVMLIGIQIMVTHRQALSQVIGFLVLENGMALAALTAAYGMPLVVEFGIFLDLLLAVFVAFVYTQRMHVIFGSLDTEQLRSLRG